MPGSPPADEESERFELDELAGLPPGSSRLPVGRHGLPRSVVVRNQRLRVIGAMLRLLPQRGYAGTSIGDLTREAGISRAAFYEQFDGKEACFLATYDIAAEWLCGQVERSLAARPDWADRISAGIGGALRLLAANPDVAHLIAIEALQAGRRRQACLGRLVEMLRAGRPASADLPPELDEMLLGGAFSHVALYVETGRTEQLPDSTAELVQYLLIPFLEPGETRRIADEAA